MRRQLLTGGTGCGKTTTAINSSDNFIIAVPCRQLAYDIFVDNPKIEGLLTGECSISPQSKNLVAVYESVTKNVLSDYSTLIIDEAHFICDEERGLHLSNMVEFAIERGMDIILLTATDSIPDEWLKEKGFEIKELKPFKKIKKERLESYDELASLVERENDLSLLFFNARNPDWDDSLPTKVEFLEELYGRDIVIETMSASTPIVDRIEIQHRFKNKEIDVLICTNVLAQGVNLPADIVFIEHNDFDSREIIAQKEGRAGRPGYADVGYICNFQWEKTPKIYKETHLHHNEDEEVLWYARAEDYDSGSEDAIDISGWGFTEHQIPEFWGVEFDHEKGEFDYSSARINRTTYARGFLRRLKSEGLINELEQKALDKLEKQAEISAERLIEMKKEKENDTNSI